MYSTTVVHSYASCGSSVLYISTFNNTIDYRLVTTNQYGIHLDTSALNLYHDTANSSKVVLFSTFGALLHVACYSHLSMWLVHSCTFSNMWDDEVQLITTYSS